MQTVRSFLTKAKSWTDSENRHAPWRNWVLDLWGLFLSRKNNDESYELSLPGIFRVHPVFHVSLLKSMAPDSFLCRNKGLPEPVSVDREEEYEEESILHCRKRRNQLQFLIRWKGYGVQENSWEPENAHTWYEAYWEVSSNKQMAYEKSAQLGIRRLSVGRGQWQERCIPMHRRQVHRFVATSQVRFCANRCAGIRTRMRKNSRQAI